MSDEHTICDLSDENHDHVRRLILEGLAERWGTLDPTLNHDLDDMLRSYRAGRTVVVQQGDNVVATGTLVPEHAAARIVRMSVCNDHRRRGLGAVVVDELVATARRWGLDKVVLETNTSWLSAVSFYASYGFEVTNIDPADAGDSTSFELRL